MNTGSALAPAPIPAPGCLTQHPSDPGRTGKASEIQNPVHDSLVSAPQKFPHPTLPQDTRVEVVSSRVSLVTIAAVALSWLICFLGSRANPPEQRAPSTLPSTKQPGALLSCKKSRMSKFLHPGWTRPPNPPSPAGCWLCSFPNVDDAGSQAKTPGTPSGATRHQHPQHPPHQRAHPHHCR